MEEEKEIYQQQMHCSNCSYSFTENFPKGTSCGGGTNLCPNCGCGMAVAQGKPKEIYPIL